MGAAQRVGRRGPLCTALALSCGWLLLAVLARATPANEQYSAYEQETLDQALTELGGKLEPVPEGKRIEAIEIRVLDVIEDRDPIPNFLNWFHANTRPYVVARELLFARGDRYSDKLAAESERNLRSIRQESLVIIAPMVGNDPDSVRVVVIVKDIWSLRLNSNYRLRAGKLELLLLQPSEENLAGTHRRVSGQFIYEPDTISFGSHYVDPRVAGSRLVTGIDSNLIVNHSTGELEGSFGSFQYGLPLYSTRQKWGWGAVASWRHETARRFVGTTLATFDADATDEEDGIPFVYESEVIAGRASGTRSLGVDVKHDFTFGAEASRSVFRAPDLGEFDGAAVQEFVDEAVPTSDTAIGPFVQYHLYFNDYVSLLDVETLSLQESFVVGPELYLRFYPVAQVFGSTRDYLGYHAGIAFTRGIGTGLGRVYAAGTAEMKPNGSEIFDSDVQFGLRVVSPSFYIGRVVYDGSALVRPHNFSNSLTSLGGDGRLRGYPSGLFIGQHLAASNLEFRSRNIPIWTFQLGGALFYDVGDAFDSFRAFRPKHGIGFGVRAVVPQLERTVIRVDWGFAVTPDRCARGDGSRVSGCTEPSARARAFDGLVLTFRQAFGVPRPDGRGITLAP